MNLVLERRADKTTPVDVIVTADTRGNYIEHMIKRCGGNALRVPDGYKAFGALKNIVRDSYEKAHSIAVALDRSVRGTSRKNWHFTCRNMQKKHL